MMSVLGRPGGTLGDRLEHPALVQRRSAHSEDHSMGINHTRAKPLINQCEQQAGDSLALDQS